MMLFPVQIVGEGVLYSLEIWKYALPAPTLEVVVSPSVVIFRMPSGVQHVIGCCVAS